MPTYLVHFLGAGGAVRLLRALSSHPDAAAAALPSGEIWAPKEATEVWIGTAVPTSYKIINPFSSETQGRIEVSPNATQALIKGAQRPLENGGGANLTPLERQMLEVDRFNNAVSEALRLGAEPGQYYSGGGYTFKIGPPAEPGGMPRIEEAFPSGDSRYDKPRLLSEAEALELARTRPAAPQSGLDEKNKTSTFLPDPTAADPKDPAAAPQAIPLRPPQTENDPYDVATYDAELRRTRDSNLALVVARDTYRRANAGRDTARETADKDFRPPTALARDDIGEVIGGGLEKYVHAYNKDSRLVVGIPKDTGSIDDMKDRLLNESAALDELSHHGVPAIKAYGLTSVAGKPAIMLQRVDGISSREFIDREGAVIGKSSIKFTDASLGDLDRIENALNRSNMIVDDLQFMIGKDGHIYVNDPMDIIYRRATGSGDKHNQDIMRALRKAIQDDLRNEK